MKAHIFNSIILGTISIREQNKNHKIELTPILNQKYQEIDLEKEVKRLYFDLKLSGYDIDYVLKTKSKEDMKWNNYIISLTGSQT